LVWALLRMSLALLAFVAENFVLGKVGNAECIVLISRRAIEQVGDAECIVPITRRAVGR